MKAFPKYYIVKLELKCRSGVDDILSTRWQGAIVNVAHWCNQLIPHIQNLFSFVYQFNLLFFYPSSIAFLFPSL